MSPSPPAVEVSDLCKTYGSATVLDGVDLRVEPGTVFALLGTNGAGKSTMIRILTTLTPFDSGTVTVAGVPIPSGARVVRERIALTGQDAAIDEILTGIENLRLAALLAHVPSSEIGRRVNGLVDRFDLGHVADRRVSTYSGGTARRLDLAMSLVGRPQVLFLDEPTTGLDPRSRFTMWEVIEELAAEGVTIFLTTQYLEEADRLAARVGVLESGRIAAHGTPDELKALVPGGHLELRFATEPGLAHAASLLGVTPDDATRTLQIPTDGTLPHVAALLRELADAGVTVEKFGLHSPTLDDVFLSLTGTAGRSNASAS